MKIFMMFYPFHLYREVNENIYDVLSFVPNSRWAWSTLFIRKIIKTVIRTTNKVCLSSKEGEVFVEKIVSQTRTKVIIRIDEIEKVLFKHEAETFRKLVDKMLEKQKELK
jgi:hypothetical protein